MKIFEHECVHCSAGTGLICLGALCPRAGEVYRCDVCGEEICEDNGYEVNGEDLCEECLKEKFRKDFNL